MDRKQSNLQIMEVTVEEVKVSIDKLAFKGGEDQFRAYAQALSPEAIKNALEAEFQLQGRTLEQNMEAEAQDDASGLSSLMITCQCCSFCPQDCAENFACCLCLLSCFVLMLFWWIICPIFYCCLKRKVERIATTSMTPSPYQTLQELGTRLKLKKIKISVSDNYLGKQKLEYISSFISGTGAKEFRFQNLAIALNGEDSEYDDFLDNTTVISKIPSLTYYMKWEDKVSTNI